MHWNLLAICLSIFLSLPGDSPPWFHNSRLLHLSSLQYSRHRRATDVAKHLHIQKNTAVPYLHFFKPTYITFDSVFFSKEWGRSHKTCCISQKYTHDKHSLNLPFFTPDRICKILVLVSWIRISLAEVWRLIWTAIPDVTNFLFSLCSLLTTSIKFSSRKIYELYSHYLLTESLSRITLTQL